MEQIETAALGQLSPPDSCHSCSRRHTCDESSPPSVARVPVEVPVWEIDDGTHSRTYMRKILISCIMILLILILVVVILRSIF